MATTQADHNSESADSSGEGSENGMMQHELRRPSEAGGMADLEVTPKGVWHRDSHYWRKCIGGCTQDTNFNKGFIGRIFTKLLPGGGSGPDAFL